MNLHVSSGFGLTNILVYYDKWNIFIEKKTQ